MGAVLLILLLGGCQTTWCVSQSEDGQCIAEGKTDEPIRLHTDRGTIWVRFE